MSNALLTTKLFIPSLRPERVSRPRLVARLNAGLEGKLTLVSAPAGFGKTSLLSEWAANCQRPVAWVSLDSGDDNPALFLSYVVSALQRIMTDVGGAALAALHAAQPPRIDSLLAGLINELAAISPPFLLILDDYHQISDREVHDALNYFLDHGPPQMHVTISTRADPPWPMARLRARGEMTEIRSHDLRFSPDETASFLNEVMDLGLSAEQIDILDDRVEGWIAGLQMAALSMQGRADASGFINAITGSHRFILDYLVEEVLDRQSPQIQEFMLRTSILSRLTGPLCDVVAERDDSHHLLVQLDQANLFLMPLDDERRWYRYHHLFADLLQKRLRQTHPTLVPDLHRLAINWYEDHGLITDAVNHALAANDIQRVAHLAEENVLGMMERGEVGVLARWLKALPDDVIHSYPWLCVACAWALTYAGRFDDASACLEVLECDLMPAMEPADVPRISGHINTVRLYIVSMTAVDWEKAPTYASKALSLLPVNDERTRGLVAVLHGYVQRKNHQYTAAKTSLLEALARSKMAGEIYAVVDLLCQIARVELQQGTLNQAAKTCRDALQQAHAEGAAAHQALPVVGYAHTTLGTILLEWNELEQAERHAQKALVLSQQWGQFDSWIESQLLLARINASRGALADALAIIQSAKEASDIAPDYTAITETLVRLASGDIEYASGWLDANALAFDKRFVGIHLERNITLARIRIAQYRHGLRSSLDDVINHLVYLQQQLEAFDATRACITLLIQQALALHAKRQEEQALKALSRALALAEPEGYVRTFIDEGVPMTELLRAAALRKINQGYVGRLLASQAGEPQGRETVGIGRDQRHWDRSSRSAALIEPLTDRELQVLQLLPTSLSSGEIGRELFIAPSTVRSHIKNIYGKLNVHKRAAAVARARELGLI